MKNITQFINEALIVESEIKVGDWVSKKTSSGGSEGFVVNMSTSNKTFQIADEWGGMNEKKWYEPKGFKVSKAKSKKVSDYKPVMDLIKKFGNSISESINENKFSYSTHKKTFLKSIELTKRNLERAKGQKTQNQKTKETIDYLQKWLKGAKDHEKKMNKSGWDNDLSVHKS